MFYSEILRGRKVLLWVLVGAIASFALVALVVALFPRDMHAAPGSDRVAFFIVAWSAALVTAIIGSILGSSLANENCHLELVRTKPISQTRYAIGLVLVDVAYLVLTFAIVFIIAYAIASLIVGAPLHVSIDRPLAFRLLRISLFPLAWFGLAQATTAGIREMKIGGMVIGLSWPIAEGLSILAVHPFAGPWHAILSFLNLINPIGYFPFWEIFDDSGGSALRPYFGYGVMIDTYALIALAIVGVVVATARWRRVEA